MTMILQEFKPDFQATCSYHSDTLQETYVAGQEDTNSKCLWDSQTYSVGDDKYKLKWLKWKLNMKVESIM